MGHLHSVQTLPVFFILPFCGNGDVAVHLSDEYREHPANRFLFLFDFLMTRSPLLQTGQAPNIACRLFLDSITALVAFTALVICAPISFWFSLIKYSASFN
jgi:hypothetical protein